MHKENEKAQTNKAQELAHKLIEWSRDFRSWRETEIIESLQDLEFGYLNSPMADEPDERKQIIFHRNLIHRFLKDLLKFSNDDFDQLSNLKISAPCIETK